jgi:hypothetical protein
VPTSVTPFPSIVMNGPVRSGSGLFTSIGPATSNTTTALPLLAVENADRTAASVASLTWITRPPAPPGVFAPKPSPSPSPLGGMPSPTVIVTAALELEVPSLTVTRARYVPATSYTWSIVAPPSVSEALTPNGGCTGGTGQPFAWSFCSVVEIFPSVPFMEEMFGQPPAVHCATASHRYWSAVA